MQLRVAAVCVFAVGWGLLAAHHQAFLQAHAAVQAAIRAAIPNGAHVVASDRASKAFAPVNGMWTLRVARDGALPSAAGEDTYNVWLGQPGESPPAHWFPGRSTSVTKVQSWIWRRDLWIGTPAGGEPSE